MSFTFPLYELHVEIADITPPIWRTLAMDGDVTLRQLHHILQAAFNWETRHLYQFRIGTTVYTNLDRDTDLRDSPSVRYANDLHMTLSAVAAEGESFTYTYDFGDDWRHEIKVIRVSSMDGKIRRAIMLAGENAGPIEDSGGPYGYMTLIEALRRADGSPEYLEASKAVEKDGFIAPTMCDARAINAAFSRLFHQGGGRK